MRRLLVALISLFCAPTLAMIVLAQEEGRFFMAGLNEPEVEQFFNSFKEAIAARDKQRVAAMLNYPIKVKLAAGGWKRVTRANDFINIYDRVFDEKFTHLIQKTGTKDLWGKWAGVTTPRGEVWFRGIAGHGKQPKHTIKIIAINGPVEQ